MSDFGKSFTKYIVDRFYDVLMDAVGSYTQENLEGITWKHIPFDPDRAELQELEGKMILVPDGIETSFQFDVVLAGEFELSSFSHRYRDESELGRQWFRVTCTGNLEVSFDDLEVIRVAVYTPDDTNAKDIGFGFLPRLSRESLDRYARDFLASWYPEALEQPVCIDPMVLAQRMNLHVEHCMLPPDQSIFGAMVFVDTKMEIFDEVTGMTYFQAIPSRTIVIDFSGRGGTVAFTIAHECMHWRFHRRRFLMEKLCDQSLSRIACMEISSPGKNGFSDTQVMEWQANSLAAHVLMPADMFRRKATDYINYNISEQAPRHMVDILEDVIDELSQFFGVSRMSAAIRMVEVGYAEALGVFNYVDGRYVPPYAFKKGSLERNQTYTASFQDVACSTFSDPELFEKIKSGALVYVDSHLCMNSPEYIEPNQAGLPRMTDYARYHMDECCLLFDVSVQGTNTSQSKVFDCALYRTINSRVVFEGRVATKGNLMVLDRASEYKKFSDEIGEVYSKLPMDFPSALRVLMKWREMTQEELARYSGIDDRTIRYMLDPDRSPKLESVIAVCIGMVLPPQLSLKLVEKAGYKFRTSDPNHRAYELLLYTYGDMDIHRCNERLKGMGCKPLNNG